MKSETAAQAAEEREQTVLSEGSDVHTGWVLMFSSATSLWNDCRWKESGPWLESSSFQQHEAVPAAEPESSRCHHCDGLQVLGSAVRQPGKRPPRTKAEPLLWRWPEMVLMRSQCVNTSLLKS